MPTISMIQARVALAFELPLSDMMSSRRLLAIVRPRQVAMYLARQMTSFSLPQIAHAFGKRDHTTTIWAISQVSRLMDENRSFHDKVRDIRISLEAPRDDL